MAHAHNHQQSFNKTEGDRMKSFCKSFGSSCFTILVMLLVVCSGNATAATLDSFAGLEGTIAIAGGTAHIPVMSDAAKAIMTAYPKIRITIEGGGSGIGVQKVGEGLAEIGNTGRPLSEAEIAKYGLNCSGRRGCRDPSGKSAFGAVFSAGERHL
jgi:ABC-type phosphate transport system substrate-binding protein